MSLYSVVNFDYMTGTLSSNYNWNLTTIAGSGKFVSATAAEEAAPEQEPCGRRVNQQCERPQMIFFY
jgi:hypothetical protein